MHRLAFIFLMLLSVESIAVTELLVTRVLDADTVEVSLFLPEPLNVAYVRVRGVDAPEMPAKSYNTTGKLGRAECDREAMLSIIARDYVTYLIESNGNKIEVDNVEWGSFGGRIIADVYISGEKLSEILLDKDYVIPYDQRDEHSWCN